MDGDTVNPLIQTPFTVPATVGALTFTDPEVVTVPQPPVKVTV